MFKWVCRNKQLLFTDVWTIIVRVTVSSISMQNDSLLCSNLYFSLFKIIHCSTETFTQLWILTNYFLQVQLHKNFQNTEWWPLQTANYGYSYAELTSIPLCCRSIQALNSSNNIVKYPYYFKCLQDWQHTYNVTLSHIHATTVAQEKQ